MAKDSKDKVSGSNSKEKELEKAGFYKGYDIRWLREVGESHPDFYLVAEYDKLQAEKKTDN
jgi:hypothetical protein